MSNEHGTPCHLGHTTEMCCMTQARAWHDICCPHCSGSSVRLAMHGACRGPAGRHSMHSAYHVLPSFHALPPQQRPWHAACIGQPLFSCLHPCFLLHELSMSYVQCFRHHAGASPSQNRQQLHTCTHMHTCLHSISRRLRTSTSIYTCKHQFASLSAFAMLTSSPSPSAPATPQPKQHGIKLYRFVTAGQEGKWELATANARPHFYNALEDSGSSSAKADWFLEVWNDGLGTGSVERAKCVWVVWGKRFEPQARDVLGQRRPHPQQGVCHASPPPCSITHCPIPMPKPTPAPPPTPLPRSP